MDSHSESNNPVPINTILEIPPNPLGGKTLVVDHSDVNCYPRPSEALKDAEAQDQVFIRPGIYEDRLFVADQPIHLMGLLKKAASGVLALLPCSRTECTLRASKRLRPCWTDFFEQTRGLWQPTCSRAIWLLDIAIIQHSPNWC